MINIHISKRKNIRFISVVILVCLFVLNLLVLHTTIIGYAFGINPEEHDWPPIDLSPPYYRRIPVRDGTELASIVYFNQDFDINQKAPTILIRTPYDASKDQIGNNAMRFVNNYNFFVVTQDMRGRFLSGGVDSLFGDDWQDGYDTIQWLKNNSAYGYNDVWWWNGLVGSSGGSALCINQYCYAGEDIPELVAQALSVGTPEQYDHFFFQGGQFRYNMVMRWSISQGAQSHQ
jgi:putative CocE/NonD family hydrolase